jgi:hypothetical protein
MDLNNYSKEQLIKAVETLQHKNIELLAEKKFIIEVCRPVILPFTEDNGKEFKLMPIAAAFMNFATGLTFDSDKGILSNIKGMFGKKNAPNQETPFVKLEQAFKDNGFPLSLQDIFKIMESQDIKTKLASYFNFN